VPGGGSAQVAGAALKEFCRHFWVEPLALFVCCLIQASPELFGRIPCVILVAGHADRSSCLLVQLSEAAAADRVRTVACSVSSFSGYVLPEFEGCRHHAERVLLNPF